MKELIEIQSRLNAPKGQYNSFGKYKYRSCEDILEALKPLLKENGCFLLLSDELYVSGDRHYVKATATIVNSEGKEVSVTAFAREENEKKGMDSMQLTGATSSYARKYALNGLFCIDDNKDADTTNNGSTSKQTTQPSNTKSPDPLLIAKTEMQNTKTIDEVTAVWNKYHQFQGDENFIREGSRAKARILEQNKKQ